MITRWTFYFDKDNIRADIRDDDENMRIAEFIEETPQNILMITINEKDDIYINLAHVRCIASQAITQEQLEAERKPQIEQEDTNE